MNNQLSGKITWIPFDSQFLGRTEIKAKDEIYYTVAKVDNFIMDSNIIKFSTFATEELKGEEWYFDINLINQNDVLYTGFFAEIDTPDEKGKIECELFQNRSEILLIGKWFEDITYTFWVKVRKI